MTTINIIFNRISGLNPTVNTISSLGSYVSSSEKMVVDSIRREVMNNVPSDSLAYKIVSTSDNFSTKQLWVIAFELEKNEEYCARVSYEYNKSIAIAQQKEDESKAKLSANKEASQDVLDYIKSNGKLLKDYYSFVKDSKTFKKEFFSKKFTMDSANEFLNK